ncbi:MAG: hypothetical protein IJM55_06130 [Ruminococcus sp.]|nr:hypothetical protein [Ruminococcus sp.]
MKNVKVVVTGAVCAALGIGAGMGGMYFFQKKNIEFAKDYSLLKEVQDVLDENEKQLPEGSDPAEAVVNGYLSQYDKFTKYLSPDSDEDEGGNVESDVEASLMNGNVLYVKINGFVWGTNLSFGSKTDDLMPKARAVIIDLRGNLGGDISEAQGISNRFLKTGVTHCFIDNADDYDFEMGDSGNEIELPVVILVNGETASASEMMTALFMQNYDNVTVIGTTTYGKGIFQDEKELSNGGVLRFTNGYYTVGDWECYQDVGIEPDITLEMDESLIGTLSDTQLKKALEILG